MLSIVPDAAVKFSDLHRQYDGNWRAVLASLGIDAAADSGRHLLGCLKYPISVIVPLSCLR
jgi:hypothetical protein